MKEVKFSYTTKKKYKITSPDNATKEMHIETKETGNCYVNFVDGIATVYNNRKLAEYFKNLGYAVEVV